MCTEKFLIFIDDTFEVVLGEKQKIFGTNLLHFETSIVGVHDYFKVLLMSLSKP